MKWHDECGGGGGGIARFKKERAKKFTVGLILLKFKSGKLFLIV